MREEEHRNWLFLAPSNADEMFEEALKSARVWFSLQGARPDWG